VAGTSLVACSGIQCSNESHAVGISERDFPPDATGRGVMSLFQTGETLEVEDDELVRRHMVGDQYAFAHLYVRHLPRLVRFIRRRVGNVQTAEDIAQESFARAFTSMIALRDPARFYPWLTVIARHLINRYHRRLSEQSLYPRSDGIDPGDGPDLLVIRRLDQVVVREALERISDRHRQVLELRERHELSYSQIAVQMGLGAESTVAPLLHRARCALRREYLTITKSGVSGTKAPALLGTWILDRVSRWRDRAVFIQGYLPEASALCASAACIVITVGLLITGIGRTAAGPSAHSSRFQPSSYELELAPPVLSADVGDATETRSGSLVTVEPTPANLGGIAEVGTNMARYPYGQEYARENMPHYYEYGDFFFGADPDQMQRDLTGTLDGDTGWMGDADPNRRDP